MKIDFVRFSNLAIILTQGTEGSAGFDLYSIEDVTIPAKLTSVLRSLGDIMRGLVWQLDAVKLVGASLMLIIDVLLLSSFLISLTSQ